MPTLRVSNLARELGVTARTVLDLLHDGGFYVKSAASILRMEEETHVRKSLQPMVDSDVPAFLRTTEPQPQAGLLADAESIFGVEAARAISRPPQARRRGLGSASTTTTGTTGITTSPKRSGPSSARDNDRRDRVEGQSVREWAKRLIDPRERRAWLNAGLGRDDSQIAEQCIANNLTPSDLQMEVEGRKIGDRLRGGGESVGSVVARLKQAGGLHKHRS